MSMRLLGIAGLAVFYASAAALADGGAPLTAAQCASMKAHHVLNATAPVGCERLRLVQFSYVGFDHAVHEDGKIVVLDAVADHVLRIFQALRRHRFPIAKAVLLDAYDGDDEASMRDNNTSGFNDRPVGGGGGRLSLHAYGLAIDLNPVENPFVTRDGASFLFDPPAGADYFNRLDARPGKPKREGMAETVVEIFARNGFIAWGGYWDEPIDYQHFDVGRALADELVRLPPDEAAKRFERQIADYRRCLHACDPRRGCTLACKEKALPPD